MCAISDVSDVSDACDSCESQIMPASGDLRDSLLFTCQMTDMWPLP